MELFIGGDPRFLSGCATNTRASDYTNRPATIGVGTPADRLVTTAALRPRPGEPLHGAVSRAGAIVHSGKSGYHHRPSLNLFLREGEWPSCGVELETEERLDVPGEDLESALVSNWFHFESDGSLGTGEHTGYELITEPLPPRCYRNPRLWAGLQNILSPWVESWAFQQTGLHVHVGTTQFEELPLPLMTRRDRRYFGKTLAAFLYFKVVGRAFADKVFLRRPGNYCGVPEDLGFGPLRPHATGREAMANVLASMLNHDIRRNGNYVVNGGMDNAAGALRTYGIGIAGPSRGWVGPTSVADTSKYNMVATGSCFTGHGMEVNVQNDQTIEFRRGKGTLNGVSILRMVEFATLLVRFAARIVRNPDDEVGPGEIYRYMAENTTSEALKSLAEAELKGA